MHKPELLNRWERPDCYVGATWYDYFGSGCGRSRDSDALERANFQAMLKALGFDGDGIYAAYDDGNADIYRTIVRENHWAVGWVEWIAIHESDEAGLKIADKIALDLQDYPVVDETIHSEIEEEDCSETWKNCYSPKERLEYLRDHISKGMTGIFRNVREACRGEWYEAANLLPCPSDILY